MSVREGPEVLVIDDEKCVRDFLKKFLELKGARVTLAEDGRSGLARAQGHPYDIVFLDVRMPDMDGIETLRNAKMILPGARFVMMTGYSVEKLLEEARQMGIFAAIKKPFDLDALEFFLKKRWQSRPASIPVLVIDDDQSVLELFSRVLASAAYTLTCVSSGAQALEEIRARDFDVAFLDIKLKDMNGIDLYSRILKLDPELDVIFMTGYRQEVEQMGSEARLKGYLFKPFDIERIFQEIENVKQKKAAVSG